MEELALLVERTQSGDLDAYGEIVHRFQDMAYGYGYSMLGDFSAGESFLRRNSDILDLSRAAD